jgi:hypothetical protein
VPRGADPEDAELFAPKWTSTLRTAVLELSWLLDRGYSDVSALALVGNRHRLRKRQRDAVRRSACGDEATRDRRARRVDASALRGRPIAIDGFNVLITLEAGLAGAPLFRGRDGVLRDIASVHGSWRHVDGTATALAGIAAFAREQRLGDATWYLDRPVANSGRLAATIEASADAADLGWRVELLFDPDAALRNSDRVVASADGAVLDGCGSWLDLVGEVVARIAPRAWIVDLGAP